MIRKLLIANRGEIALRIINTCREMGIESVAMYSAADAKALHVEAADSTVAIGPPQAAESYLSITKIIDAARSSSADAIHPGYGFLSENAEFAAACRDASLVFVGPSADVIARMGSKIEARRLMQKAGVPIVPGETPENQTDDGIKAAIKRVGLPVLIKASAGGGGKGMRNINDALEIDAAVQSARREAISAFGDGTLYVERLIKEARHVEVQIFGDAHGHVVHLFERDCSTQRRHQKVIEESPSPGLTPAVRKKMTAAAIEATRLTGYQNAGTIEFLLEGYGDQASFYFLEMNTRLQVEHPVTESVTGTDLVRAQILVASGEPLPWTQEMLSQRGHAIECRIYAEDPAQGFLPQAGRLLCYREPHMPGVRIDSGVTEGSEVSIYYDPMLAKLIASGETRETARERAIAALRSYPILGIPTNIQFLLEILAHERFITGSVDTSFLDTEGAVLAAAASVVPEAALAIAAAYRERELGANVAAGNPFKDTQQTSDPWTRLPGWRS